MDAVYSHNVDAMLIAEVRHLPTVNGFATFTPPGWNLVKPDDGDAYLSKVREFAARHRVEHLCNLDLKAMQWR